jgi:DNA-binding transcriptional LysR family regulator
MVDLGGLQAFVQVVDHGGFAAAARALGLPKSSLSKRVAALEHALGVRLIQRSSRRFVVTEAGQDCYRHAAAMVIEAEAAEAVVRGRLAEPSGIVRLTASVPTAQLALAPLLPVLVQRWPKLRLVLHATDRLVDLVAEGFDLAVRDHFAPLPDTALVQRRLRTEPNLLVAAPGYLDRRGAPAAPDALAAHDGLMVAPAETVWRLDNAAGERAEAAPAPRFFADDAAALLEAAAAGLGIARLPATLCRHGLDGGRLRRVLPGWTAGSVATTLLMPHRRGLLPAVRAVADFLIEQLAVPGGAG